MSPLLEQFIGEGRELLQNIAEKLICLEAEPDSSDIMNELFRLVHTLKGSSGLFDFPEMTRVLHAGEDLMDAVRDNKVAYSRTLADQLLQAMDFVSQLLDEIEELGEVQSGHAFDAKQLSEALRLLMRDSKGDVLATDNTLDNALDTATATSNPDENVLFTLPASLPLTQDALMQLYRHAVNDSPILFIHYTPEEECFFKGEDPLFIAQQVPLTIALAITSKEPWPAIDALDPYRCLLTFEMLSKAACAELEELFRYIPEQVCISAVNPAALIKPQGTDGDLDIYQDFITEAQLLFSQQDNAKLKQAINTVLGLLGPNLLLTSKLNWLLLVLELSPENRLVQQGLIDTLGENTLPAWDKILPQQATKATTAKKVQTAAPAAQTDLQLPSQDLASIAQHIWQAQLTILAMPDTDGWFIGRLNAVGNTIKALLKATGLSQHLPNMLDALNEALASQCSSPLTDWLNSLDILDQVIDHEAIAAKASQIEDEPAQLETADIDEATEAPKSDTKDVKFGRRADDLYVGPKTLKVDQTKIDRLMSLIGEMVVSKNALPYLANRAEIQYGVRELSREIKNQYAVINRISEEMQDAIMQVRMMPVSYVFQRFPRLVRDISRRIGKEVNLVLEGEDTQADKNIIEALADPLMHIVRNSLDHGIETVEARLAAGKPAAGTLRIKASQESDSVLIEISDDGKGINPEIIKRKAYEKGLIDEVVLERLSDQEAINLIFAAGFSTAETVSDLSGRGVGMDVVRTAIEQVNGSIKLTSETGKGTLLQLTLPLSMAVKSVLIVESHKQVFGIPMELVVETVRVPAAEIRTIKNRQAAVLRNKVVPLCSLNEMLALSAPQHTNDEDEYATLVIRHQGEQLGIIVDDFMETVDIILKPMTGVLGGLSGYAGTALLGDGTVLMVLNPRELM